MKFKASFQEPGATPGGAKMLEKALLPTLEKFGKTFQLLIGPDDVHLIQTAINTDGPHVTARAAVSVLFDVAAGFRVQSRHYNLIGLSVDVGLLLKALRSASAALADAVEVKLVQRAAAAPGGNGGDDEPAKPFLSFNCRGDSVSLLQDLPVSRPFPPAEIDRLAAARDAGGLAPFYLDLKPAAVRLGAALERMKGVGSSARLAAVRCGDLHLQVAGASATLGCQITGLGVYPQTASVPADGVCDRRETAEQQLAAALDAGAAATVVLQLKHLTRVLAAAPLSDPAQILCGIADGGGHVHVMYVYRDPRGAEAYDDSIGLSFKLPVREDD